MHDSQLKRSTFVTGLAWAFILLGGFAASVSLLQYAMTSISLPHDVMQVAASQADTHIREFARLIFGHLQLIFLALSAVFVTTLVASIGLLKRINVARIVFVGLMVFGILWNIASTVLVYYFVPLTPDVLTAWSSPPEWPFSIVSNILFVFGLSLSLTCIGLFWWIAWRLVSEEVRREF